MKEIYWSIMRKWIPYEWLQLILKKIEIFNTTLSSLRIYGNSTSLEIAFSSVSGKISSPLQNNCLIFDCENGCIVAMRKAIILDVLQLCFILVLLFLLSCSSFSCNLRICIYSLFSFFFFFLTKIIRFSLFFRFFI